MKKTTTLFRVVMAVLAIGFLTQFTGIEETSWAVMGQDTERQTVPTRTPTPEPITPTEPPPARTDTPAPPSATDTPPPSQPNTPTPLTPSITPAKTATPVTATLSSDTSVYSGPGLDYPVVGALKAGDTVTVVGRNADGTWWGISYQEGTAWIPDEALTISPEAQDVPVLAVSSSGTPGSEPSTLPESGSATWLLGGGLLLLANGLLLLLAGVGAYRRKR